jgi:hypothetical protein
MPSGAGGSRPGQDQENREFGVAPLVSRPESDERIRIIDRAAIKAAIPMVCDHEERGGHQFADGFNLCQVILPISSPCRRTTFPFSAFEARGRYS